MSTIPRPSFATAPMSESETATSRLSTRGRSRWSPTSALSITNKARTSAAGSPSTGDRTAVAFRKQRELLPPVDCCSLATRYRKMKASN
ncbi:hypothetical protein GUJ93_ZPchr0013g36131 [Zizania palustris]|uniref:Uncharacterized protein n=1 Tax=Zizania palustris TaxID=103762 RepID=A0A8J5WXR3_ZIZPA|nr:hypothetical protein GUJ93_ZPchr0013g36131 [Zizania palustris]KAG8099826.1 hypothetical protein GUJ93_ZPchr0013g36131 [Zizania palustris]